MWEILVLTMCLKVRVCTTKWDFVLQIGICTTHCLTGRRFFMLLRCFIITFFSQMTSGIWESLTTPIILTLIFFVEYLEVIVIAAWHYRKITPENERRRSENALNPPTIDQLAHITPLSLCFVTQGSRFRSWFRPKEFLEIQYKLP